VLVPSNNDRHPPARCSAVNAVVPEAVLLLEAGVLFPIGVQANASNAS
jgi:hypothetical protein